MIYDRACMVKYVHWSHTNLTNDIITRKYAISSMLINNAGSVIGYQ